jgi:pyridoxine 5-phosphate synthase
MVTFVSPGNVSSIDAQSVDLNMYSGQVQDFIAEFRSNNILSSVLIDPTLSQVKSAAKLEFDYVEFNASVLADAPDMNAEIELLEEISGLTVAANKLGMGVNISGEIGYDNIRDIGKIDYIEDIIVGRPIYSKALSIGIEQATRDIISLL